MARMRTRKYKPTPTRRFKRKCTYCTKGFQAVLFKNRCMCCKKYACTKHLVPIISARRIVKQYMKDQGIRIDLALPDLVCKACESLAFAANRPQLPSHGILVRTPR